MAKARTRVAAHAIVVGLLGMSRGDVGGKGPSAMGVSYVAVDEENDGGRRSRGHIF